MSNKKTNVQPLSEQTKLKIIIAIIVAVAVVALGISLAVILSSETVTPDTTEKDPGSSSLTISNGDFTYVTKDALNNGKNPYEAQDWKLYTFDTKSEVTNKVTLKLNDNTSIISGIVDTSDWETVTEHGVTVANPKTHDEDSESLDKKVYMLSGTDANVAIVSKAFSIAADKSAKITVWLDASLVTSGNAKISVHTNSVTSLDLQRDGDSNDQLYVSESAITNDGWTAYTFYLRNNSSDYKYMYLSVSLGDVYENTKATGTLFVDDITFESITNNDYRIAKEDSSVKETAKYAFTSTDTDNSTKATLVAGITDEHVKFDSTLTSGSYLEEADAKVNGKSYSPFIENDLTIYKLANDGNCYSPVSMKLSDADTFTIVENFEKADVLHVTFWLRVVQKNKLAKANVLLKQWKDGEWQTVDGGSFTSIVTSTNIVEDNCGWTQYHVYVTPALYESKLTMEFFLGNENGYDVNGELQTAPEGTLYVTAPQYEMVTASSSGSNTKTVNITGTTATTNGVTNGSFSSLYTASNIPQSWYPVFAGSNALYKDGKGNTYPTGIDTTKAATEGTGVEREWAEAPTYDDVYRNVLKLNNALSTSQGFVSSNLSLSAKTVYAFSVLAKTNGNTPYIYLIDAKKARDEEGVIIASVTSNADTSKLVADSVFGMDAEIGDGWTRYYFVVVTGSETMSARLALFNGSIDGASPATGTIYYDQVNMTAIGSYTLETDAEDEEATNSEVKFAANTGYTSFEDIEQLTDKSNLTISQPSEEEWKEITKIEKAEEDTDDDDTTTTTKKEVDWALLFGTISSIALLAALIIVVVVNIYKKNKKK